MSSLRAQLAALAQANPDSNKLDSVARRDSYIYSPSQAGKLSSDQIHQIGIDGLLQLITSDQEFQKFRHPLFGEAAKRIDRTLLDQDAASELKQHIDGLLYRLAPHILTKPSAYVIEWLVRRFRFVHFQRSNCSVTISESYIDGNLSSHKGFTNSMFLPWSQSFCRIMPPLNLWQFSTSFALVHTHT